MVFLPSRGPRRPFGSPVGVLPHPQAIPLVAIPRALARVLRATAGGGRRRSVAAAPRGTGHVLHRAVLEARNEEPALQWRARVGGGPRADLARGGAMAPPPAL